MPVSSRFKYNTPTRTQLAKLTAMRHAYTELEQAIEHEGLQPSRALSLALTKLEESAMWLNKAITHENCL